MTETSPTSNTSPTQYPVTEQTMGQRHRERLSYDVDKVHALLDELYYCNVVIAKPDAHPIALPLFHARVGETLYLHGSTGAGSFLSARNGTIPISISATSIDGLVYARSWFHHSANYRSVIAFGDAELVIDADEKWDAFAALVERLGTGRSQDSRPPTKKEFAQTSVLKMTLQEVSYKERSSGVGEDDEDLDLPHWSGIVPLRLQPGTPEPGPGYATPTPAYINELIDH